MMMENKVYHCQATTPGGFVQQLAVSYLAHGYWFYVTGRVPEHKRPEAIDQKLINKYDIALSRARRCRRKQAGLANLQYLRHGRFFLLLATHGAHPFFVEEAGQIRDVRRRPIAFAGYSIGYRNGHPSVRIAPDTYKDLKADFIELAAHRSAAALAQMFATLPFEPYAPVRSQLQGLLRAVNRVRRAAAFAPLPASCLRLKRRIYRPFEPAAANSPVSEAGSSRLPRRLESDQYRSLT